MQKSYHDFSFKVFCVTVPKTFAGERFGVSEFFGYQKVLCIREGGITFLRRKLCVTVPKNSVEEHFDLSEKFVCRKILCIRREYH